MSFFYNVAACEGFFLPVVEVHFNLAVMSVLSMTNLSTAPSNKVFPEGSDNLDFLQKQQLLMLAVQSHWQICNQFSLLRGGVRIRDQRKIKREITKPLMANLDITHWIWRCNSWGRWVKNSKMFPYSRPQTVRIMSLKFTKLCERNL